MGHPAAAGATLPDGGPESRFLTATDGVRLHLLQWSGERPSPWAVVVYLHGIASHAGWFSETAAHLSDQGVTVYAPDRRGSGRSGGPRGHLDRYRRALDDAGQAVRLAAAEPTRCGSSTPRPGSSGRPRGWTACAGAPAPA